ncbi:arginine/serine-rich coiled-coil protein 2-like [Lineus longissimus]|uniref:arginine/serine-rich coiled-coil protein 2-like n=1 Tax=Lineus longissimus TaxID=88925 RepID=UPI002B4E4B89
MGWYSDSDDDRRKYKKKKRRRSRSGSLSSDSSYSSRQSKTKKSKKPKHKKRKSRSRSLERSKRRRSYSRSHSRSKDRYDRYESRRGRRSRSKERRYRSRSRSRSHDRSRSRDRHYRSRSRSRERSYRARSRSRSRDRRRSRSRSRSKERRYNYKSRSRSRSASRRSSRRSTPEKRKIKEKDLKIEQDDPTAHIPGFDKMPPLKQAEIRMQLALKAADAANEKLKAQGVLAGAAASSTLAPSVADQLNRAKIIEDIESDGFRPVSFKSGVPIKPKKSKSNGNGVSDEMSHEMAMFGTGNAPVDLDTMIKKRIESDALLGNILYEDMETKMKRWVQKLTMMRRQNLEGEAMS